MSDVDNKKALEDIQKVVLGIMSRPESDPFRTPVDWEGMGLMDYPIIVKRPMDLGTIKSNLDKGVYQSLAEAAGDVRLVWMNCMTYNQDGSEFYQLADVFARKFEETYAELRQEYGLGATDPDRIPSMDEKIKLSYDIFKIDMVSLGKLIGMIEKKCPRAVEREGAESSAGGSNETLLNVDGLTPRCFHEVAKYIQSCAAEGGMKSGMSAKRKKGSDVEQPKEKKSKQ